MDPEQLERWRGRVDAILSDPDALPAVLAALKRGGRQGFLAYAWAAGWVRSAGGAQVFERVIDRYKREAEAPAGVVLRGIPVAEGVEVRLSLARWGGRELAHVRTWFRRRDGRNWRPTERGVTVAPEQLGELEAAVRALREAHAAGALGPPEPLADSQAPGCAAPEPNGAGQ